MKFRVRVKDPKREDVFEEDVFANSEAELKNIYGVMGQQIIAILDKMEDPAQNRLSSAHIFAKQLALEPQIMRPPVPMAPPVPVAEDGKPPQTPASSPVQVTPSVPKVETPVIEEFSYFSDGETEFRFNKTKNMLEKKVWVDVPKDSNDFALKIDNKIVSVTTQENIQIVKKDWVAVNSK